MRTSTWTPSGQSWAASVRWAAMAGIPPCVPREDRENSVALGAHGEAAVLVDLAPDDAHVRHAHRVPRSAELLGEPHGPLDVGPQERDGPGRKRSPARLGVDHVPTLLGGDALRERRQHGHRCAGTLAQDRPEAVATEAEASTSPSAITVATRGWSSSTASSPICSPAR